MPGINDQGCVGWDAKIDKYGNAKFSYTDEAGSHDINAARWAWIEFRSPLTKDDKLANTCGVKHCQELDHWEVKAANLGKTLWELYELKFTKGGPDDCWPWQEKSRDKDGYGIFSYRDKETGKSVTVRATRWAWEQLYGPLDPELFICHTCDFPPCNNPDHWFAGYPAQNSRDMIIKNRQYQGERHHKAVLARQMVEEMRRLYAAGGVSHRELAVKYGVGKTTVTALLRGKTWKH